MKKILLILMLVTIITGCKNEETQGETINDTLNVIYQNSNKDVIKEQEVEGIVFDNVNLKTNSSMSFFTANVTNTNSVKVELKYIKVTAFDDNNKVLFTFSSYIGDYIDINQTLKLSSNIEGDLTKVKSIKYEIVK